MSEEGWGIPRYRRREHYFAYNAAMHTITSLCRMWYPPEALTPEPKNPANVCKACAKALAKREVKA